MNLNDLNDSLTTEAVPYKPLLELALSFANNAGTIGKKCIFTVF
jgi:hypothetical protein